MHSASKSRFQLPCLLLAFLLFTGCAELRRPVVPLETASFAAGSSPSGLVIFLPGYLDDADDFERRGFVDIVRKARPDLEMLGVDAHIGYYRRSIIIDRLYEDVLRPARERGVEEIWLVGVSLGGMGAFGIAQQYPDLVTGVVGLAPYLGPRELIREIDTAGGPLAWRSSDPEDPFERVWGWLQEAAPAEGAGPRIYLGYGADDRRAAEGASKQLARLLPEARVKVVPGGHDWPAWSRLLEELIARGALNPG
jgi:hypothetical protein